MNDYPQQFSGGMRQRVMIAMALACNPSILIADEPTTALDVTIQAQILELMLRIKDQRQDAAILLITHNLAVVAETCNRVIVMYGGKDSGSGAGEGAVQESAASLHARLAGLVAGRGWRQATSGLPRFPAACPAFSICRSGASLRRAAANGSRNALDRAAAHRNFAGTLGALPSGESMKILEVENLRVRFPDHRRRVRAQDCRSESGGWRQRRARTGRDARVWSASRDAARAPWGARLSIFCAPMVYGVEISGSIKYHHASGYGRFGATEPREDAAVSSGLANDFSGPLFVAQSANDGGADRGGAAEDLHALDHQGAKGSHRLAFGKGGA